MKIRQLKNNIDLTCHKCKCKASYMISNDVGITGFYCEECIKEVGSNTGLYIRTVQDLHMIGITLDSFIDWKKDEIIEFLDKIGVSVETFEYDLKIAYLEFQLGYIESFKGRNSDEDKEIDERLEEIKLELKNIN